MQRVFIIVGVILVIAGCVGLMCACGDADVISGTLYIVLDGKTVDAITWEMEDEIFSYNYPIGFGYVCDRVYDRDGRPIDGRDGPGTATEIIDGMDLYAHYTPKMFTLVFNAEGGAFGDGTTSVEQKITYSANWSDISIPIPTPSDPSYEFDGWFWSRSKQRFSILQVPLKDTLNEQNYFSVFVVYTLTIHFYK